MTLAAGTRRGTYEISVTLDAGGTSDVYRATDGDLKRDVAINVLPELLADDAGARPVSGVQGFSFELPIDFQPAD